MVGLPISRWHPIRLTMEKTAVKFVQLRIKAFTLLESLLALFVVSFILLGYLALFRLVSIRCRSSCFSWNLSIFIRRAKS